MLDFLLLKNIYIINIELLEIVKSKRGGHLEFFF